MSQYSPSHRQFPMHKSFGLASSISQNHLGQTDGARDLMRSIAHAITWRVRTFHSKARSAYQTWQRKRTRIDEKDILKALQPFGSFSAPALMVHSSLSACGQMEGGPATVVAALESWIGPDKLLVMPTHTYCYPTADGSVAVFDATETPSVVGKITDYFWRQPVVLRSLHPTHSLASRGPESGALCAGHETCETPCGRGSPYRKLVEMDCSVLMFGCTMNTYTLYHTAEDAAAVPYLYCPTQYLLRLKHLNGKVLPFPMWRQDMNIKRCFSERADWLEEHGLLLRSRLGVAELLFIPHTKAVHQALLVQLKEDPFFLVNDAVCSKTLAGVTAKP